ncbi:unnamed protein product, partial [Vitis vinifera]
MAMKETQPIFHPRGNQSKTEYFFLEDSSPFSVKPPSFWFEGGEMLLTHTTSCSSEVRRKRGMKLVVEIVDAHDLLPRDGEGSASPFVEVDFENQRSRTTTVPKNLNPVWNQKLLFNFDQAKNHHHQTIEVCIYHERRQISSRAFLGRARIPCSTVVKKGEEVYQTFQLEKKRFFSSIKGEVGLKIYLSSETEPMPVSNILNSSPSITRVSLIEKSIRVEANPHIYKYQVLQQPAISVEKGPQGISSTMHQANPDIHPSPQDDYNLKEMDPQLGERGIRSLPSQRIVSNHQAWRSL